MEVFEYNQQETISCSSCGRRVPISQNDLEAGAEHARRCDRCRVAGFLWTQEESNQGDVAHT